MSRYHWLEPSNPFYWAERRAAEATWMAADDARNSPTGGRLAWDWDEWHWCMVRFDAINRWARSGAMKENW